MGNSHDKETSKYDIEQIKFVVNNLKNTFTRITQYDDGSIFITPDVASEIKDKLIRLETLAGDATVRYQECFQEKAKSATHSETQTCIPWSSWNVLSVLECIINLQQTADTLHGKLGGFEEGSNETLLDEHFLKGIGDLLKFASIKLDNNSMLLTHDNLHSILQNLQLVINNAKRPKKDFGNKEHLQSDVQQEIPRKLSALVNVEVVDPLPSGATESFFKALQNKLESKGIKPVLTEITSFNDTNSSESAIVICSYHSRLLANITNTLSDISKNQYKRICLLVVHCKAKRLLTTVSSKSEVKDKSEFHDISEVVDIAYDRDDGGIYDCEMNELAFRIIDAICLKKPVPCLPE